MTMSVIELVEFKDGDLLAFFFFNGEGETDGFDANHLLAIGLGRESNFPFEILQFNGIEGR